MKTNVVIVGGGSSAHLLIPLLASRGHNVSLLTRKPTLWSPTVSCDYINPQGEKIKSVSGSLKCVSDNPEDVIPNNEIIILCAPVSQYRNLLHVIAPYIQSDKEKVYVGTVYGQGGFNWMVNEIVQEFKLSNLIPFAVGLIPWICRIKEYGKIGITYGSKQTNCITVKPLSEFKYLSETILDDMCFNWFGKGKFELSDNFLSFTLSVDNQIIHPSRMCSIHHETGGEWLNKSDIPFFYSDYDDFSAESLKLLDDDYEQIRVALIKKYPKYNFDYMLGYLPLERFSYGSHNSDIKESFITSETLGLIETPTVRNDEGKWVLNKDHRFFYDDIYYGLLIVKWFAIKLDIDTPMVDKILEWSQRLLEDNFIENNKIIKEESSRFKFGDPSEYGFENIDEIIKFEG
jgi:hypothetical protein